jgi:preprotein translocase subunit SecE
MKDMINFFSEVRIELAKVIWPKYEEWLGSTIVMLVLVLIFSLYLGVIDFGFSKLASYIFKAYSNY